MWNSLICNLAPQILYPGSCMKSQCQCHGCQFPVVVVGPTPPPKNGGRVQQPFLRTLADGIRVRYLTGGPLHSTSRCPTSTGAVHKSVTCSCVLMLVQLNKYVVVCGSDLQRGTVVMGV